jgi:hypothetical protein
MKVEFKTAYGKRQKVQTIVEGESLTQQHMKDEVDIRNIIRKHDRTGILDHVQRGVAHYGDYTKINEYRTYLDFVKAADESFQALPSNIRERFHNDAGVFYEYATDPKNEGSMVEMGLFEAPKVEAEVPPSSASPEPVETAPKTGDNT